MIRPPLSATPSNWVAGGLMKAAPIMGAAFMVAILGIYLLVLAQFGSIR